MFEFLNHGSVILILPIGEAAEAHAAEVYPDAMRSNGAIVCEPRYALDNVAALMGDGYRVKIDGREVASIEPV